MFNRIVGGKGQLRFLFFSLSFTQFFGDLPALGTIIVVPGFLVLGTFNVDVYSTSLISVLISHAESSGILLLTWHLCRLIVFQFLFLLLILFC